MTNTSQQQSNDIGANKATIIVAIITIIVALITTTGVIIAALINQKDNEIKPEKQNQAVVHDTIPLEKNSGDLRKKDNSLKKNDLAFPKETTKKEFVNSNEYIEADGFCLLDLKKFPDRNQATEMAKICATTVAKANLVEKINGAVIKHNIKIENQSNLTSEIESKVEGLIKAVEQINDYTINDNSVSIKLKVKKADVNNLFN